MSKLAKIRVMNAFLNKFSIINKADILPALFMSKRVKLEQEKTHKIITNRQVIRFKIDKNIFYHLVKDRYGTVCSDWIR